MSQLLTPEEVADRFRVGKTTVLRWGREGLVPTVRVGKTVRFRAEDIDALIKGSGAPTTNATEKRGKARTA